MSVNRRSLPRLEETPYPRRRAGETHADYFRRIKTIRQKETREDETLRIARLPTPSSEYDSGNESETEGDAMSLTYYLAVENIANDHFITGSTWPAYSDSTGDSLWPPIVAQQPSPDFMRPSRPLQHSRRQVVHGRHPLVLEKTPRRRNHAAAYRIQKVVADLVPSTARSLRSSHRDSTILLELDSARLPRIQQYRSRYPLART